ncbi:lysylphosphatidylglycerol synthase transmembrane domain-containing protein [Dyadobacter sp. CY312]|uniref:lysylphosphatidylglycerol synthase transmembrane domain-containing protein n=1 Tax=Dyadobacter sp. CY312 TaxID=2907303 RepID=UPI001F2543B1|nr:lysylphosphatidylglycerol synthase transmembrane domain-containing protein [Dyadobacter sp. CY312]MCE7043249.1 flippase-like domain-containing protein [Dyadobacter sp. CY312]
MGSKIYKAVFLLIGILTLGYMVYGIGLDSIWLNIQKTGIWFIPVIGSWLVIYILNAYAFKAIIQEPALPRSNMLFWDVLRLTITGYAINYITPFVALGGEPYRIMELKPKLGINKATSSVLLYSLMHMFSHVLFWLVSILLILAFIPVNNMILAGCAFMLVTSLLLGYWFIRVYKKGFTVSTVNLLTKLPFVGKKAQAFATEKADSLLEIDDQIRILYADRKPRFYLSLWLEFAARVVGCAEIYFTAIAIGLDMSVTEALVVSSGSSLFANLIFFFPMQLGTREGGLAMALRSVGLPAASGIFIGVVMRIREIVWILIGLALMNKKGASNESDLQEVESELTYVHSIANK